MSIDTITPHRTHTHLNGKPPIARTMTAEELRLQESHDRTADWQRWGPYLSERQWGTVREDYSEYGNCWDYFSPS